MKLVLVGVLLLILAAILALTYIGIILALPVGLLGAVLILIGLITGGLRALASIFRRPRTAT